MLYFSLFFFAQTFIIEFRSRSTPISTDASSASVDLDNIIDTFDDEVEEEEENSNRDDEANKPDVDDALGVGKRRRSRPSTAPTSPVYECKGCERRFNSQNWLTRHVNTCHQAVGGGSPGRDDASASPYLSCRGCQRKFPEGKVEMLRAHQDRCLQAKNKSPDQEKKHTAQSPPGRPKPVISDPAQVDQELSEEEWKEVQ